MTQSATHTVSRRQFLSATLATACSVSLMGAGLGFYARRADSLPATAIRPPGALPEEDFLGACIRCGMCVRDCPYNILFLAQLGEDAPTGTPYFIARTGPCEMCEDIPCITNCPTNALDHSLTDIEKSKMGLAVVVDQETCIAFHGLRCEVCFNVCPVRGKAITLDLQHNVRSGKHALFIPVVHSDGCTGCGLCEKACVMEEAAIKVFPMHLAKGELGGHYRLGWQEKAKAGKSLVTPDTEHQYNLPEGVRYDLQGEGLIIEQQQQKKTPFSSNPLDTLNKKVREMMAAKPDIIGAKAITTKGWFKAHQWLILRRLSQLTILAVFLTGPLFGIWIARGNLAFSLTLDTLPLTDPHILLQALISGVTPENQAIIGVFVVLAFYSLVGGRVYCSWVCPVNMVTDAAAWLRQKLSIRGASHMSRSTRYWVLALTLILPVVTGSIVWELFNPVSMMFRGIVYGLGMAWVLIVGIFLFDLLISRNGWCGHLCPVGAFYSLLSYRAPLRVTAANRNACDDCMDCFAVCPEPQVIKPALKGGTKGIGPVILSNQCTNCGRCIDVCAPDVFSYGNRFNNTTKNSGNDVEHNSDSHARAH